MAETLTGGCLCGEVRFACSHESEKMTVCHCQDCRKAGGAAAAHILRVDVATLRIDAGEPATYEKIADSENVSRSSDRSAARSIWKRSNATPNPAA